MCPADWEEPPKMADNELRKTTEEKRTALLIRRFRAHINEWYPKYVGYKRDDFEFYVQDAPFQLWRGDVYEGDGSEHTQFWFLWTGDEVMSFKEQDEAFMEFINGKKARRLDSKLRYYTSPLTISAVLAVLLLLLIAGLEFRGDRVPNQLWSIFTAVVAFYFGRESSRRSGATDDTTLDP
jgi:hypothetical protein